MKDSIKNRKKKLLALCLSLMMFSSVTAFAACTDGDSSSDSSSSSSTTEEVKDDGLIKNADFTTFDKENAINTSVTGWARATTSISGSSALSSKAASGILDLEEDAWHNLTGSNVDVATLTEETAKEQWDNLTVKDKLAYYELWESQNEDEDISEELSFYESINIKTKDIPTVEAFSTHPGATDTKVLMIHNQYPESNSTNVYKALGTGQQYTSSSTVTIPAGSSAQFSVWVKTKDLQSSGTDGSAQEAIDKGAFISVTHSVGGKQLDAYKIENINTERMGDLSANNGWAQYTFLLKGSSYSDTTFNLVLGLGQGSMNYRGEYVNGYAFFDDIECEIIDNDEYDTALQTLIEEEKLKESDVIQFADEGDEKIVNVAKNPRNNFAMDFYGEFEVLGEALSDVKTSLTETDGYTSALNNNPAPWFGANKGKNTENDVTKTFSGLSQIEAEQKELYDQYFAKDKTFYEDYLTRVDENDTAALQKTLLLISTDGAAYTATTSDTAINFEAYGSDYLAISFFVKTSKMDGYTGASVTLVDGENKTSFSTIDTTAVDPIKINDEQPYSDWQRYIFYVENDAENSDTSFSLQFNFGPTSIDVANGLDSYHAGFAAFTGFEILPMDKAQFESAQSGTNAKIVSVQGDKPEEITMGAAFDSEKATPSNALEKGLAEPLNYFGAKYDSAYVTGTGSDLTNTNKNAGLISKEEFLKEDGYFNTETGTTEYAWLDGIKAASGKTTAEEVWKEIFSNSSQPLLIYNVEDETKNAAYGYIGTSKALSPNTYTAISLRVRGTGKAYIRLVDTNADNYDNFTAYNKTLSISNYLTFWYNDDGNICTGDPEDKKTQVAFKLQTNGLYKANARGWDGYAALENKDAWYANLDAYTEKDEKGNLLVAKGGATHDYNDYWNNAGMNGIAFYWDAANNRYCADEELKVPVLNLADVPNLAHRTEASESAALLEAYVDPSKNKTDEWTTVTFYVHTGDTSKNYRLEIWSGEKATVDGKETILGNPAGTYLVVDYNNPGDAESNFTSLLTEYEDKANAKFESVFSYYDTASFLRYNKDLDEKKNGNLYEGNYVPSENTEGIAFLQYIATKDEQTLSVEIFADYQYSEKTVIASEVEEDTEEESSSSTETETNVWLLVSSLAVAAVLLLAIGSIIIRKVILKAMKNKRKNKPKKNKK